MDNVDIPRHHPHEVISGEVRGLPADIFSLGAVFALLSTLISRRSADDFDNFRQNTIAVLSQRNDNSISLLARRQVASNKLIVRILSKDTKDRPTALKIVSNLRSINGFPTCDFVLRVSPP